MTPKRQPKEIAGHPEGLQIVERPVPKESEDPIRAALIQTYTSGKALVVLFNSQSTLANKYRQFFWRRGMVMRMIKQNGSQIAWVEKGNVKPLEEPAKGKVAKSEKGAVKPLEEGYMNLRATVQTYVENLTDSDLAQAVMDLAGPTCSFCQQESCTHPVHLVLDDLAIELLDEETVKRKEWSAESAPTEA